MFSLLCPLEICVPAILPHPIPVHMRLWRRYLQPCDLSALRSYGCEGTVPKGRTCYGALHLHCELRNDVQVLGRRNFEAFDGAGRESVIVDAVGCGAALKGYPECHFS